MAAFPGGGNALRFPDQPTGQYGTNNTQQLAGVTTADWRLFFGDPKGPIDTSAYGPFKRENFALPDAYKGSLPYMTNLIITLVTDEDMWPTKIALPFRLTEGEMEIVWDEIIFNNSLLGPVPEEGVSRLVTQQVSERRDHYVRYGLALMLEHGFMRTEKGRTCYRMNLEQIRNAILETAYIGVLEAYLACKLPGVAGSVKYRYQLTGSRLGNALAQEVEDFACIQKTEHGFDLLDSRAKRALRGMSIKPDMWILPEGLKIYLTNVRRENFDYLIAGPQGAETFQSRGAAVDKANDCMIFEAKQFELPNEPGPVDVLQRRAVIGEYYVMQNHLRGGIDPAKYRSNMRDIFLYNEDKDAFSRVTLEQALNNCCRFTKDEEGVLDWGELAPPGSTDLSSDWTYNNREGSMDMFAHYDLNTEEMGACRFFGDMTEQHLRDEGLSDWAASVQGKLVAQVPGLVEALRLGPQLFLDIDTPLDTNEQKKYFELIKAAHSEVGAQDGAQWNDQHNIPQIPVSLAGAAPGAAKYNPVGYSTWGGICMLSEPKYSIVFPNLYDRVVKFKAAFEALFAAVEQRLVGCVLLDKAYTPQWFTKKDAKATFFTNLFNPNVLPMCVRAENEFEPDDLPPGFDVDADAISKLEAAFTVIVKGESRNLMTDLTNATKKAAKTVYLPTLAKMLRIVLRSDDSSVLSPEEEDVIKDTSDAFSATVQSVGAAPYLASIFKAIAAAAMDYKKQGDRSAEDQHDAIANLHQLLGSSGLAAATTIVEFVRGSLAVLDILKNPIDAGVDLSAQYTQKLQATQKWTAATAAPAAEAAPGPRRYVSPPHGHATFNVEDAYYIRTCLNVSLETFKSVAAYGGFYGVFVPPTEHFRTAVENVKANLQFANLAVAYGHVWPRGDDEDEDADYGAPAGREGVTAFGAVLTRGGGVGPDDSQFLQAGMRGKRSGPFGRDTETDAARRKKAKGAAKGAAAGWADSEQHTAVQASSTLSKRWKQVSDQDGADMLVRVLKHLFLLTRVTRNALQQIIRNHDVFPFGFLLMRPYMTYQMGSGILTVAGRATGETLIGHADFQMADNVVQKMHIGNFTMYLKSVVYQQQNVYIAENIYAQGYVSGNGMDFWAAQDAKRFTSESDNHVPSIYSCLVPYESSGGNAKDEYFANDFPNPLDVTGAYSPSNPALGGLQQLNATGQLHYASARFYSALHRWDNSTPATDSGAFGSYNRFNTLCFQGHTAYYNPASGNYDLVQTNTGHWGTRVYPGCGKVRKGLQKLLEPVNYTSAFGDTAARVTVGY